jgi:hypothetical protein
MGNLPEIKALVFALKDGSPGTEIVFLNQNLAIHRSPSSDASTRTSWVRSRIVSSTS